ncbi:MAG: hypothetical protein KF724_13435, partial [Phycisphaeraceae bacterium]|nr:hypothetical protein [Phycisphaeraceae bacterium]
AANAQCAVCDGGGGGNPACNAGAGDCCVANGTPGCDDENCCNLICSFDSFCCNVQWDSICANAAVANCGCELTCPPSDHDCYSTGGPGCTDEDCCSLVCSVDPFCCQVAWDGICVNEAFQFCGVPECPFSCTGTSEGEPCGADTNGGCNVAQGGSSNCCFAWGGIGCDDQNCQDTICSFDPFCCDVAWDGICAAAANDFCPDICFTFPPQFGSISCGETICGTSWADNNFRDTDWFVLDLSGFSTPVTVTVSISNQLPMVIGIVNSTDCATASSLNPFAVSGYCGSASFTVCLAPTVHWIFAGANGFSGFPCDSGANEYALTVECGDECLPPACGNSDHDCYTTGGPFCSDEACCNLVCAIDPFCCQVAWDGICVNEAFEFCGAPACPLDCVGTPEGEACGADENGGCNAPQGGTSNCCIVWGGAGCDDPACQDAVCAADPFCCDVAWDGLCSGAANQLCPDICFLGSTNFGSISCNETICGTAWADGNFRDTDWYILELADTTEITVTISNQLPMVIGIVNSTDCATASFLDPFAVSNFCGTASFTVTLPAGTHWVFAAPNAFSGFPCGSGSNDYSLTVSCPISCFENPDQTNDGCVNGADIAVVLGNWNPAGGGPVGGPGDVNCDGFVNGADIALVLGAWLTGPNCP